MGIKVRKFCLFYTCSLRDSDKRCRSWLFNNPSIKVQCRSMPIKGGVHICKLAYRNLNRRRNRDTAKEQRSEFSHEIHSKISSLLDRWKLITTDLYWSTFRSIMHFDRYSSSLGIDQESPVFLKLPRTVSFRIRRVGWIFYFHLLLGTQNTLTVHTKDTVYFS